MARELLGRSSQVLQNGIQGVQKTWGRGGTSDLAHLVAPLSDTELGGPSMMMLEASHRRWRLAHVGGRPRVGRDE